MKKKSASQSAFLNLRLLTGPFLVLTGVFLALIGIGRFSAQAQQNSTNTDSINPLLPPGFDCSQIRALGLDRQDNLRAGAIRIACGEAQGGSASLHETISQVIQKALTPEAYGATDVNLITGADTFSHITQSETFAAANPDNPDQIVVAYNDSRDWPANSPTSPAHRSPPTAAPPSLASPRRTVEAPSPIPLATPLLCTTAKAASGSPSGSTRPAAVRAWAGTGPPLPGTRTAGPISAFTTAPLTTESLAGSTTTQLLRATAICTFPGTTSLMEGASESSPPPTTVSLGATSDSWPPPAHSAATSSSPATWGPQATCTSLA